MSTINIPVVMKPQTIYRLEARRRDADGNIISRRTSDDIPNVFTNHGVEVLFGEHDLTQLLPSSMRYGVGTGSAAPSITDPHFDNFLVGGGTVSGSNSDTFVQESPTSGYIEFRQDALFPVGSSGGNVNVTEVGAAFRTIVDNLIPLCSRALVVDGEGNPTAFEWLEDEELLLTAFHRRYISLEDVVLTDVPVDGDGPDQTITIRPSALGTLVRWGWPGDFGVQPGFHAYWGENYALPPDHLVNSTGSSSGAGAGNANQSNAEITTGTEPYVPGSKQRTRWGQVNTGSDRNVVGVAFLGAASAQSTGARAFGQWCIKLDPGIPKSSLHRFRIGLTFKIDNTP